MKRRIAVVLLNLGGPDRLETVQPFLRNLFADPAILRVPAWLRRALAAFLAARRAVVAREIYARIGGGSPILANTNAQADALGAALTDLGDVRIFVAMRHWHPRASVAADAVRRFAPEGLVLLPLYPQFSTTTTASSLREWWMAAKEAGLTIDPAIVCCYPTEAGFVGALAEGIRAGLRAVGGASGARLLLTAHGLPERVVMAGDPYRWQVERTAAAVVAALDLPGLDWQVCYQSRVGPLRWIGPATDAEVRRAGAEGRAVVMVPISFVSEHSETLVELDMDYGQLAREAGVRCYHRVATVGTAPAFIAGLAGLVRSALVRGPGAGSADGGKLCPASRAGCWQQGSA